MGTGVVVDTSYLITLADSSRKSHAAARHYWQHFIENQVPIFLPTIVVSEFCIHQEIPADIRRACIILPFNWDDALKAAELDFRRFKETVPSRDALKDDVKIIAQAAVREAGYLITDDGKSMHRTPQTLRADGKVTFVAILLERGFDRAALENGQGCFNGLLDQSEADPD